MSEPFDIGTGDIVEVLPPPVPVVEVEPPGEPTVQVVAVAGPPGPPGEPGESADTRPLAHTHPQLSSNAVWDIQHDLGFRPGGILCRDSLGEPLEWANVTYPSLDRTVITFGFSVSGTAELS